MIDLDINDPPNYSVSRSEDFGSRLGKVYQLKFPWEIKGLKDKSGLERINKLIRNEDDHTT